jgi:hypothetical protein
MRLLQKVLELLPDAALRPPWRLVETAHAAKTYNTRAMAFIWLHSASTYSASILYTGRDAWSPRSCAPLYGEL